MAGFEIAAYMLRMKMVPLKEFAMMEYTVKIYSSVFN